MVNGLRTNKIDVIIVKMPVETLSHLRAAFTKTVKSPQSNLWRSH